MAIVNGNFVKGLVPLLERVFRSTVVGKSPPAGTQHSLMIAGAGSAISMSSPGFQLHGSLPTEAGPSITIYDDGDEALAEFVTGVLKADGLEGLVSPRTVRERVIGLIRKYNGQLPNGVGHLISSEVIDALRGTIQEWTSLVPVCNLVVQTPLTIGDVTFVGKDADATGFAAASNLHVQEHLTGDKDVRRRENEEAFAMAGQAGDAFAKVQFRADHDHAADSAISRALSAVNALRAFTSAFYPTPAEFERASKDMPKVTIGLPNEIPTGWWAVLSLGGGWREINTHCYTRRGVGKFDLDGDKVRILRGEFGFDTLHIWASTGVLAPKTVARAVWECIQNVGRSVVASTSDQRLLFCIIGLEVLLFSEGEQSTIDKFVDRLALLLGDSKETRVNISTAAKSLYRVRSQIVHDGANIVDPVDALRAENFAMNAAMKAMGLQPRFEEHGAFCRHLHDLKFG